MSHRILPTLLSASLTVLLPAADAHSQPVIDAVRTDNYRTLTDELARGADVNARQGDGATALHHATHRNNVDAVTALLAAGATVNVANELGATPLWLAARNGSSPLLTRLLNAGADPNAALKMGETPLMSAARAGSVNGVALLLDAGADVHATEHERGQTALMWAVAQQHPEVVRLLLAHGADVHARTRIWDQLENTAGNTNPIGNFRMKHGGSTPLLFAARHGNIETAQLLITAGARVNDTAASGTSALVIASHSGHGPFAQYLLAHGADPNAAEAGYTALHAAVLRSESALVEALLAYGANPDTRLAHGSPGRRFSADYSLRYQLIGASAFWLAAKYGELEILRILSSYGSDPLVTPSTGMSALHAAMGVTRGTENRRNRVGIPVPDPGDEARQTRELVSIVLDLGVDIAAVDARGNTALHLAVRKSFPSVIELLADHGADLHTTNESDDTPLSLAESAQPIPGSYERGTRPSIATLLRRLGAQN